MNFSDMFPLKDIVTEYTDFKTKSTPVAMVAPEVKQTEEDKEITRTCAVLGCEDYKTISPDNLYPFPEDPDQRQVWTNLTGRHNWTPTDYSYICYEHFSVDSFYCGEDNNILLMDKAIPSLKLPNHVLEVEYIDDALESEDDYLLDSEQDTENEQYYYKSDHDQAKHQQISQNKNKPSAEEQTKNLMLFSEVQKMQHQLISLRSKFQRNIKKHNQQTRYLKRLQDSVGMKEKLIAQKTKKKNRILLSVQDKIREDTTGLVMAMPTKHTEDMKDFALNIYKYSPQAYIYVRNTLRTLLPSTAVLESWLQAGLKPRNTFSSKNTIKLVTEQTARELSCKVSIHH